ncbi:exodeoxyribonuclease VII small subunit [Roseivirga ehrenbergii]|uniref:Exodeoxyribonuclease VII small subunit n=3 Tax=Roseivirga TaxID=290180 RepID=A0A0L8AIR1_9BACT|nr:MULTISPECIES: exodeoxyribonuclease VII small subunit [Roseivirga]KOF02126.1 exodeoxyribonuclease VII [Roseivirga seohaensis subsp. aquiponti]KYG74382.1 exodeoxyribonuclease VII [Roseivirga ehrenbergii]KYG79748.1 exodeoxyribonuclease VII [Roseivirga seohaensis]TCL14317.1 exodeoxyribonuclease VII small subunit [Roseivirga ehrenbergii]|tara:strand:- start:2544 stop:2741 length:198 start_codon:yes stop_codon:yes gene_type:complete
MSKKKLTYKESLERIETIVDIIENQQPDIDDLSSLVKEATQLIKDCKSRLKNTEEELNNSLENLE